MTDRLRLRGPDDFVRLDAECARLLEHFFRWLQTDDGGAFPPATASGLAHAADRYLRDFLVDIVEADPADHDAALVRRYLGNWYVIHTLNPTHEEVDRIHEALTRLYRFLAREEVVSGATARAAEEALAPDTFFHERLEAFWELTPEGIPAWRAVDDYRTGRSPR